jgi:hypothetical protein
VKTFDEQIRDLRDGSQSISSLSLESNDFFAEKYGPNGTGGKLRFDGNFIPGKFYSCDYKTKTKVSDKIPFINRHPIFIFLKKEKYLNGSIAVSVDLGVIPPNYRGNILMKLWNQYHNLFKDNSSLSYESQIQIQNISKSFDILLAGTGWKKALTGFKVNFMDNIKVIDYEDIVKIPYLSDFRIEGQSINEIYNDYRSKFNP